MNKFKKISVILIAIVTIVGTFAINSFAYISNGKHINPLPNFPSISNVCIVNDQPNPSLEKIRYNASPSYYPYQTGSEYMTDNTGDIASSARIRSFYLPNADPSYYGFNEYYYDSPGILINRVYTANGIESLIECGKPVIAHDGTLLSDRPVGISIRGGAFTSAPNDLSAVTYRKFSGGYRVQLGITDIVSGYQTIVGTTFENSTTGELSSTHILNHLVVDALNDFNINNEQYIFVLDYIRVSAYEWNYLFESNNFDFFGFDINYIWDNDYSSMTNSYSDGTGNNSIFSPFYQAEIIAKQVTYDVAYEEGFNDGFEAVGVFGFIINGVEGFLSAELFPGFSFGILLMAVAGIGLFIWILKIFAGG